MNRKNRILFCLIFVITVVVTTISAGVTLQKTEAAERTVIDSGSYTDQNSEIKWTLYDDGELCIEGKGNMHNSSGSSTPWITHRSSILSATVSEGITSVAAYAFDKCENLKTVTLEEGITSIGSWAFLKCVSLEEINIPKTVVNTGYYAFRECSSLTEVIIPDGVEVIEEGCFAFCNNIVNVTISDTVTDIKKRAFYSCGNLTDVELGDSVETIGEEAFCDCKKITAIELPDSATTIGNQAFYNCTELSSVKMSGNIQVINTQVFFNTAFYADYANWDNGFLYSGKALLDVDYEKIPENCKLYSKTEVIAGSAFQNCQKLKTIALPDNLKHINNTAFAGCSNLEEIVFPDGLESIGNYAFKNCEKLVNVVVPDKVAIIGTEVFAACDNLERIELGNGVSAISDKAFASTPNLTEIFIPASVISLTSTAFENSGIADVFYDGTKANWKRVVSGATFSGITVHYTLRSEDESVIIHHTDDNFDWEAGNVHLVVEDLGDATSSYEQNGFYNRLMVDPIQVLDIKLVDGDGNNIQPLSDETITVKIRASEEFMNLMKSGLSAVSEYNIEAENIDFFNDCFVFAVNGESVSIPADESFLKKFKIIHWYSDATEPTDHESFTHDEISVENGYIVLETNHFSEYAVCTEYTPKKDYTINWVVDGVVTEQTVTEESTITKPANPEKEGYTFIGWTPEVPDTMPPQNLEFTAVWQINRYTITFDTAGGSTIAPITLEYGAAITPPATPTKYGYTFVSWTPGLPETMPANDITVVAEYEKAETPDVPKATVTGIEIISLPNKTQYTYKVDSLDLNGIAVKVMCSDGTSKIITDTKALNVYGFNVDSVGTKTITVEHSGYTDEFEITVSYVWWQWIIRILLLGFIWY